MLPSSLQEVVSTPVMSSSADQRVAEGDDGEDDSTGDLVSDRWTWLLCLFTIVYTGLTLEPTIGEWIALWLLYITVWLFLCRREVVSEQDMNGSADQREDDDDEEEDEIAFKELCHQMHVILWDRHREKILEVEPDFPNPHNLDSESEVVTGLPNDEPTIEDLFYRRPEGLRYGLKTKSLKRDWFDHRLDPNACPPLKPTDISDVITESDTKETPVGHQSSADESSATIDCMSGTAEDIVDVRVDQRIPRPLFTPEVYEFWESLLYLGITLLIGMRKGLEITKCIVCALLLIVFQFFLSRPEVMSIKPLDPQKGCEDIDRPEVHKPLRYQSKGTKREVKVIVIDPPLRDPFSQLSEEVPELPLVRSRRLAATEKHDVLRESIEAFRTEAMDEGVRQIAREGFQTLANKHDKPSPQVQKDMCLKLTSSLLFRSESIKVCKFLGKGGEGFVFGGKSLDKRKLAIKLSIKKDQSLYKEYQLLQLLSHESVVHCFRMGHEFRSVVVMEFAKWDLQDFIKSQWLASKSNLLIPLGLVQCFSLDIARGLQFIHSKGFVHNDIKPMNILIVEDFSVGLSGGQCILRAKISDFGFAQKIVGNDGSIDRYNRGYGTSAYASPECLLGKYRKDGRLSDIWAFGVIVYRMITYHSPFPKFTSEDKKDKIKVFQRVDLMLSHDLHSDLMNVGDISGEELIEVQDIVKRLLNPRDSKREPMDVLVRHKWFDNKQRSDAYNKARSVKTRKQNFLF